MADKMRTNLPRATAETPPRGRVTYRTLQDVLRRANVMVPEAEFETAAKRWALKLPTTETPHGLNLVEIRRARKKAIAFKAFELLTGEPFPAHLTYRLDMKKLNTSVLADMLVLTDFQDARNHFSLDNHEELV